MNVPENPYAAYSALVRPVIDAGAVAAMIGIKEATFRNNRAKLEAEGFPPKLPGVNGWSRACVLRWIETNGATFLPPTSESASAVTISLEERYGQ